MEERIVRILYEINEEAAKYYYDMDTLNNHKRMSIPH